MASPSDALQGEKGALHEKLSFPFPERFMQTKRKGGTNIDFVPYTYYVARLNEIEPFGWSCNVGHIEVVSDRLLMTVSVSIRGRTYTGTGVASASKDKDDWGGAHAEAFSQAFRRACMQFGMGLYMYHNGQVVERTFPDDAPFNNEEDDDAGPDSEPAAGDSDAADSSGDGGGDSRDDASDSDAGERSGGGVEKPAPTEAQKERLRDLKETDIFHEEEMDEWRESMRATWTKANIGRIIREMKDLYEDRTGMEYRPS